MKPYYEEDNIQIYCGDCLSILPSFAEKSVDLVLTSPPYDNLRDYNKYSFDFENIAKELYKVISVGGVIVWVVGDATINGSETGTSFKQALYFKNIGFNLHDTMIWEKSMIPQNSNRYEPLFEYMFILSNGSPKTFNPIKELKRYKDNRQVKNVHREKTGKFLMGKPSQKLDKNAGNIFYCPVGGGINTKSKIAHLHPAIFPEKLGKFHIISWSKPNDLILDPFLGSGTTAVVAKELGRKCIGIEISEAYCKICVNRLKNTQKDLFL